MNTRLKEIIQYKTHGSRKKFAELIGWKQQYLSKLLRGDGFGLQPVIALLAALPEINARWLLLGEGKMLMDDRASDLYRGTLNHLQAVLDLERFVPVMTEEELRQYEQMITSERTPLFSEETRKKWLSLLIQHKQEIDTRIAAAMQAAIIKE